MKRFLVLSNYDVHPCAESMIFFFKQSFFFLSVLQILIVLLNIKIILKNRGGAMLMAGGSNEPLDLKRKEKPFI